MRVYLHAHIERPDGRRECFHTKEIRQWYYLPSGKLRIKTDWIGWRTVRDAVKYPDRQIFVRDACTRTRITITE